MALLSGVPVVAVFLLNSLPYYILENNARIVLNRFHYDIIKARYGEKAHLLFTDTDSLMYHIETPDVNKDMVEMKDHFNLSKFERTNRYYEPGFAATKALVGKMKDEVAGNPIAEFVGLRPKSIPSRL